MGKTNFQVGGHNVIRYSTKDNKPHSYYVECYSWAKRLMVKCDKWFQVNNIVNSKCYTPTPSVTAQKPVAAANQKNILQPVARKATKAPASRKASPKKAPKKTA